MDTYTADEILTVISYNIGAPSLTSLKYSFVEDPPCSYPETVTLVNLPDFVMHNESTSDFTISQNSDLSLIGSYPVTIRSEIQVPDDFTMTTFTTMFVEYEFLIHIEPCLVTTYTDTTKVPVIIYNIGAPALTTGKYVFEEDPVCNYPEIVTVTNLPTFASHNEVNSDFTIPKNSDLDIIGLYTVQIRSEIQVPDDYTKASYTTMFVEYDFEIHIQSCIINSYDITNTIPNLTYTIGDPDLISPSYLFDETPVCNYPETVTLTGLPTFVTHQETSKDFLIAKNEDLSLDATYTVTLRSEILVPDDHTLTSFTTWS